jgi:hypothetical protein
VDAAAKRLVAQALAHGLEAGVHLAQLAVDPRLAAFAVLAACPGGLQARQDGRIHQPIGQCFPGLDLDPRAALRGDQLAHGRQRIDVFHDHARIKNRLAAFHHQAGHLAQRVGLGNGGVIGPDVFLHELEVEPFLGHHDTYLAYVGAGVGSNQFHVFSSARGGLIHMRWILSAAAWLTRAGAGRGAQPTISRHESVHHHCPVAA